MSNINVYDLWLCINERIVIYDRDSDKIIIDETKNDVKNRQDKLKDYLVCSVNYSERYDAIFIEAVKGF